MKKKVLRASIILILGSIFFSSCNALVESFNEDVKDYMKKYTETAEIAEYVFDQEYPIDSKGYINLPSDSDKKITLYLINPQNFYFTDPLNIKYSISYQDDAAAIINSFNTANSSTGISAYTFIQDPLHKNDYALIEYTFSEKFLQETDGGLNISPEITFTNPNTDNQTFDTYADLKIVSNSAPVPVRNLMVLQDSMNSKYVLAFYMPDMSGIHKDMKKIIVNGEEYNLNLSASPSVSDTGITFTEPFVSNYSGLTAESGAFNPSDTNRLVYYKTDNNISTNVTPFTVTLKDARDLATESTVSYSSKKLEKPVTNPATLTNLKTQDDGYATVTINPSYKATDGTSVSKDITVYYIIKRDGNVVKQGQGKNTTAIKLGAGSYTYEAWTHKPGYIDSDTVSGSIIAKGYVYVNPSYTGGYSDGGIETPYKTIENAKEALNASLESPLSVILLEDYGDIINSSYTLTLNGNGHKIGNLTVSGNSSVEVIDALIDGDVINTDGTNASLIFSGSTKVAEGKEVKLGSGNRLKVRNITPGDYKIAKVALTNEPPYNYKTIPFVEKIDDAGDNAKFDPVKDADLIKRFVPGYDGYYFTVASNPGTYIFGMLILCEPEIITSLQVYNTLLSIEIDSSETGKAKLTVKDSGLPVTVTNFKAEVKLDDVVIKTFNANNGVLTLEKSKLPSAVVNTYSSFVVDISFDYNGFNYHTLYNWEN